MGFQSSAEEFTLGNITKTWIKELDLKLLLMEAVVVNNITGRTWLQKEFKASKNILKWYHCLTGNQCKCVPCSLKWIVSFKIQSQLYSGQKWKNKIIASFLTLNYNLFVGFRHAPFINHIEIWLLCRILWSLILHQNLLLALPADNYFKNAL